MNLFYKIWVDCILYLKSQRNAFNWKFYSIISMSIAMAVNLALIISILQRNIIKKHFYGIPVNFLSNPKANGFLNFFLYFLLPPLIMNYLLIFRNKNYERLILKYQSHNGKWFALYFIFSLFFPLILILVSYFVMSN
jgi:hypothetical protein